MIRSRRSPFLAVVALAATALAIQAPAQAAAPSNDSFSAATVLTGSAPTATGSNVEATTESNEPLTTSWGDAVDATLWYRWTAPQTAYYAINTAGSDFDTTLNVYTGSSLSTLSVVAMNDEDFGSADLSATGFAATAGTTYDIQVGGTGSSTTGNVNLAITTAAVAGTMTFGPATSGSDPDPMEGCIGFFTSTTFTNPVATACGTGNHSTTAAFALGSVPAGTYYLAASDDDNFVAYPGAASPSQLVPLTVPGGNCTLTGMNLNFAAGTWTPPTGKDCSTAPACISARAALPGASSALAAANSTMTADVAATTALHKAVTSLQKKIKSAKKHHKSTTKLAKKLKKLNAQLKVSLAKTGTASAAVTAAQTAQTAAQNGVTASC